MWGVGDYTSSIKKNYFCEILSSGFNISEALLGTATKVLKLCIARTPRFEHLSIFSDLNQHLAGSFWLLLVRESQQRRLHGLAIYNLKVKNLLVCEHLIGKKLGKLVWDSKIPTCLSHHCCKVQQHPGEVNSSLLKLCVSIGPAGSLESKSILTSFLCVTLF